MEGYTDLKTKGLLKKISYIEKVEDESLIFPENLFVSRIEIKQRRGSTSTEVYGVVPTSCIDKKVELVRSYYKLPDGRKLFTQEFYVEGKRIINQAFTKQ